MTRAYSGRPVDEVTREAIAEGALSRDDVRVHPETLRRQADVSERDGNQQLATNLRRAAELASLPDERVLAIYDALRPRRSSRAELEAIAARLEAEEGAPLCGALVREALAAYSDRRLLR